MRDEDVSITNGENSGYCKQQYKIIKDLESNAYVKWKVDDKEILLEGDAKAAQIEKIKQDISPFCTEQKAAETASAE